MDISHTIGFIMNIGKVHDLRELSKPFCWQYHNLSVGQNILAATFNDVFAQFDEWNFKSIQLNHRMNIKPVNTILHSYKQLDGSQIELG